MKKNEIGFITKTGTYWVKTKSTDSPKHSTTLRIRFEDLILTVSFVFGRH